jgi:hypothetical protein
MQYQLGSNLRSLSASADGCKSITTLTIRVEPLPTPRTNPPALVSCDDDQTIIGTEQFDLTTNITYIQNNYPNVLNIIQQRQMQLQEQVRF